MLVQNNLRGHSHRKIASERRFERFEKMNTAHFNYFATLIQKTYFNKLQGLLYSKVHTRLLRQEKIPRLYTREKQRDFGPDERLREDQ